MFASCKTCNGNCCSHVDFGCVAFFHFLGIDWIQYPPPYHTYLDIYPGLRIKYHTIEQIVEWLKFFGFVERADCELFKCTYQDEETYDCRYYKNRPDFCRGYDCYDVSDNRFFKRYRRKDWH